MQACISREKIHEDKEIEIKSKTFMKHFLKLTFTKI